MRNIVFLFYVATIVLMAGTMGCDSTQKMSWNKTSKKQGFKIGSTIKVEGMCYDLDVYTPARNEKGQLIEDYEANKLVWSKKDLGGDSSKLEITIYDPNDAENEWDVFAPIGVVVCSIHNPKYYEEMTKLWGLYPSETIDIPSLKHQIVFTGKINSFEKYETAAIGDIPRMILNSVRIHVESIEIISSQPYTNAH